MHLRIAQHSESQFQVSLAIDGNIAFAELDMKSGLDLSEADFGLASGLFFVSYAVVQVLTMHWLTRFGARRVLATILLLMSLTSGATGFVLS